MTKFNNLLNLEVYRLDNVVLVLAVIVKVLGVAPVPLLPQTGKIVQSLLECLVHDFRLWYRMLRQHQHQSASEQAFI